MAKGDSKKSKYRGERILPNSLIRLHDTERSYVAEKLLSSLSSIDEVEKETAGVIALCYSLGLNVDEVLSLNTAKAFSRSFDEYLLDIPLSDNQWNPATKDRHLFDHVITSISLPLPTPISSWLKGHISSVRTGRRKNIHKSQKDLVKSRVKKMIARFRNDFSRNITLDRICASFKSEVYSRHQDVVLSYLLLGKSNFAPPHTRYYYVPNRNKIYDAWCEVQKDLWRAPPISQASFLSDREWNGWVIGPSVLERFIAGISLLPNQTDTIAFHNAFTRYVVCMLVWNLGHRGVDDPFCEIEKLCLQSRRVLILDKYKHGYENLRLLPLPNVIAKQLDHYIAHLKNLGNMLEYSQKQFPLLQSFRQYIQHLLAGKDLSNKRFLFLINKDTHQLQQITPNEIQGWFRSYGLPVKANFGRHYIATRLMAGSDITFTQTQFFLGHSMREKTDLYSEANLDYEMNNLSQKIHLIMKEDGWLIIKGFRFRSIEVVSRKKHFKIDPDFFPPKKPGFVLRAQKQEEQWMQVKAASKVIIQYLTAITKIDETGELRRDKETEATIAKSLVGLNFPYHPGWSAIKRVIREDFDSKNPLPEILKFQNLSTGVSSLTSGMLKQSELADKLIDSWVEWINTSLIDYLSSSNKDIASLRRRAALIVNAALLGGAHKHTTLSALAGHFEGRSQYTFVHYQTNSTDHVEIFIRETYEEDGELFKEESWFDRWLPDPLSMALLKGNDQELLSTVVIAETKRLVALTKLPLQGRSFLKRISKATLSHSHKTMPIYQSSIASGKVFSRPQSINSWARHLGRKPAYSAEPYFEKQDGTEALITEFDDNDTEKTITTLESIKKQLSDIGNQAEAIESATRVQRCQFIESKLTQLESRIKHAPFTINIFFSWARYLSLRGTRGESKSGKVRLQASTIKSYTSQLFTSLFIKEVVSEESFPYLESMAKSEVTDFFVRVVDRESGKSSAIQLKRLLHMFHRFARDNFDIYDCDWDTVDSVPLKYRPPKSGEIISVAEYERLIESMLNEQQSGTHIETLASTFVAIMMFRFGLRPSEAFRIMPTELLFDRDQSLKMVLVSKNHHGETKTKKGVRRVPCTQDLSEWETWIIRNLYERAAAYSEIYPHYALTNVSYRDETRSLLSQRMSESSRVIGNHLKMITGDRTLSAYTLRHSFITHTAANIIEVHPSNEWRRKHYLSLSNTTFLGKASHNRKLEILSMMSGHRSVRTTLRTYIHCSDLMNAINHEAIENVNDSVYASLVEKNISAYRTQKHRMKGHQATVERAVSKSSKPLGISYRKSATTKCVSLKDLYVRKPNLIQIGDFMLVKSKRRLSSKTSLYNNQAFGKIADCINKLQTETPLKNILDMFSNALKSQLVELYDFVGEQSEALECKLSSKTLRKKLRTQLTLWVQARNPNDGKWVVLNENELKSILSMTHSLGIFLTPIIRQSSFRSTCHKKRIGIEHFNHSSNGTHPLEVRRKNGYEVVFKKDHILSNSKTINLFLTLIALRLDVVE